MKLSELDYRFLENYHELFALKDYLDMLEKQISSISEQERVRLRAKIKEQENDLDEADLLVIQNKFDILVDELLPRFFRGPFIVTLWSVIESSIVDVANYIQKQKNKSLSMKDIRGKNFLNQANKYFEHVIDFNLFNDKDVANRLEMLRILRNVIAHCNGRLDSIKNKKDLTKIEQWSKENIGITLFLQIGLFYRKIF